MEKIRVGRPKSGKGYQHLLKAEVYYVYDVTSNDKKAIPLRQIRSMARKMRRHPSNRKIKIGIHVVPCDEPLYYGFRSFVRQRYWPIEWHQFETELSNGKLNLNIFGSAGNILASNVPVLLFLKRADNSP